MVNNRISKSDHRMINIDEYAHPKTKGIFEKWRREGLNISDRVCTLVDKYDEAEQKAILQLQNGGLTPNEAFLASEAVEELVNIQTVKPVLERQEKERREREQQELERQEQERREQLARERARIHHLHNTVHLEAYNKIPEKDLAARLNFCMQNKDTCYHCAEEGTKVEGIINSHPGHKQQLEEAIEKAQGFKYSKSELEFYESHSDTCMDCKRALSGRMSEWAQLQTTEKIRIMNDEESKKKVPLYGKVWF